MYVSAVKEKVNRQLSECTSKIEEYEAEIQKLNLQVEEVRIAVQSIDKEINEAGASMANLRENIRVRKLMKDISDAQAEIDSYDMEEAAKAKRNFNEKYQSEKERETRLQGLVWFVLWILECVLILLSIHGSKESSNPSKRNSKISRLT